MQKLRKRKPVTTAVDTAVVDKLSGIITAAQVRHDEMVREVAVLRSKVELLHALVDGLLAGPGCEFCRGGLVDDVDMVTGAVTPRPCSHCG